MFIGGEPLPARNVRPRASRDIRTDAAVQRVRASPSIRHHPYTAPAATTTIDATTTAAVASACEYH